MTDRRPPSAAAEVVDEAVPSPIALAGIVYAVLWCAAAVIAFLIAGYPPVQHFAAEQLSLSLRPAPQPRVGDVVAFFVANFRHGGWMLLVALILPPRMSWRFATTLDTVVGAVVLLNVMVVAAAIAVAGTELLPFVPHLPVEWAGLAVAAGGWIRARCGASRREVVAHLAVFTVLIALAAGVEVYAVPH